MAEGINVGSVEVSVVPDAREFNPLLQAAIGPASDEAAKQISDAIAKGIRDGLSEPDTTAPAREQGTKAGDSFGNAFQSRVKAALAALPSAEVTLDDEAAQAKLDYLREELTSLKGQKVGVDISDTDAIARLTALRAEMDNLAARSGSIQINADTAAAAAQLDKFFAETSIKAKATGDEVGKDLTDSAAKSAGVGSPLIMSAVAAGLIAGGPAVSAAGILVFGGLAAAAAAQVPAVKTAFSSLKTSVMADVQSMGQEIAPTFVAIAGDAQQAFNQVEPAIHQALAAVAPEVQAVAQAFEGAAETAIPAFTRAIQGGQPIINGLSTLIRDIGSGVAGLMDALTAHSGAEGSVLSGLGSTLNTLLPMVGTLLGEGAELGSTILPPINTALRLISGVLDAIAPVLPIVVAGFVGFKAISALSGPLDLLSAKLQTVAADGGKLTTAIAGNAAAGVSQFASALPAVAIGVGIVGAAFEADQKQISDWAQALLKGGAAAEQATAQMDALSQKMNSGASGFLGHLTGVNQQITAMGLTSQNAKADAQQLYDAMSPLEQKQQDVTTATNDLQLATKKYGENSGQAVGASYALRDANSALASMQAQVSAATDASASAEERNATRLQGIATTAGGATSQINLLKGALDALTGKQVSMVEAQDAVIQATNAAEAAAKNQTGALVVNNDVMGTNTARAAASREALIQVANSSNTLIATMEHQGATSDQVNAKDATLRASFIKTAEQMGYSAADAKTLADNIYGIPASRTTEINADTNPAQKAIDDFLNSNSSKVLHLKVGAVAADAGPAALAKAAGLSGGGLANGGVIPGYAPGVDSVPAMLSPGEGVLVPEAVRGIGGAAAIQAINSTYSNRVQGFANGGVVVGMDADTSPAQSAVNNEVAAAVKLAAKVIAAQANAPGAPSNPSGNAALGKVLAGFQGWGSGPEWDALYALWQRESGWRNTAQNLTSTAYGIPQLLNGTWAATGYAKSSDAATQINAGLKYIGQRFHDPIGAWAHEMKFGWYDQGGELPPGPSLVYNGTGGPELIAPKQTFEQVMSGASGGAPSGPVQITGTLDLGNGLTGVVRGEIAGALGSVRNALTY